MDESQFHDFQAASPLDPTTLESLRRSIPRATLTPTRLTSMLRSGSLPLDPAALIERHFDVGVTITGEGLRELVIALPKGELALDRAQRYLDFEGVSAWETDTKLVLTFGAEDDEPPPARDPRDWLPALAPLRAMLLGGDPRPLYLGWLLECAHGELDDGEREPPIPAGLAAPDAALATFAELFALPAALLARAAEKSPALAPDRELAARKRWLAARPAADKDAWLLRVLTGEPDGAVRGDMLAQLAKATGELAWPTADPKRTAGALRKGKA